MLEHPILKESLAAAFEGRVHLTDNLFSTHRAVVLFAHESSPLFNATIGTSLLNPKSTLQHDYYYQYLQASLEREYAIIDLFIPSRKWKLKQTTAGTLEEISLQHELLIYLWDNVLAVSGAKNIFFVGSGFPVYSLANLIDCRQVEETLKGVVLFSSTFYLPITKQEKSEWYKKV